MDSLTPPDRPASPQSSPSPTPKDKGGLEPRKRKTAPTPAETHLPAKRHKPAEHSQSAGTLFFIEDDVDRQQVLADFRQQYPGTPVITLSSPQMLDKHHLIRSVICPEEGQLRVSEGLLFSGEPMILVLDLTAMTPGQIASLNDLLDSLPKCEGRPLSPEVHRVALVNMNMLTPGPGRPGPDCWRRLQAFSFSQSDTRADSHKVSLSERLSGQEKYSKETGTVLSNRALLQTRIVDDASSGLTGAVERLNISHQTVHADFAAGDNWRTLLFGSLTLNDQGTVCFCPGILAGLSDHQTVILHDAPWDSHEFVDTLATALREGGYRANGQWITLPDSVNFSRRETDSGELSALKQRLLSDTSALPCPPPGAEPAFVCLNGDSLESALGNTQVYKGIPRSVDTLSELLGDCQQLRITGMLTGPQWLRLLRRVDRLGKKPEIVVEGDVLPNLSPNCQCKTYTHESTALDEFDGTYRVYRFTAKDQWESLWHCTRLVSEKAFRFEQEETELLKALKEGVPVVLHGMENHPALAARLESLLANPPYLFVGGHKIPLPKARVTFLWPEHLRPVQQEEAGSPLSLLWQLALQQATRSAAPPPEQEKLITLLKALPPSTRKTYPDTLPWETQDFQEVLNQQIEQEKQQDGASQILPAHHRKALHTLLVKNYRGDDEVYGYLKTQIRRLYPDKPVEMKANRRALQQWLQVHPRVDRDLLKKHFWSLVRHCPVNPFSDQMTDAFKPPTEEDTDLLAEFLVGCVAKERRAGLARQLGINPHSSEHCRYYDDGIQTRLRDALLVAGDQRKSSAPVSEQVKTLEATITSIIDQNKPEQAITRIRDTLTDAFSGTLLVKDFKDLPTSLVTGHAGSRRRQQRRVKRLAARVSQYPLVFLQGVAGAGKSHIAQAVVGELKQKQGWETMPEPTVLSLGPETTPETLYGQQNQNELMDGDRSTSFVAGPLLKWAMNDNPPVLILDEANMVQEGVLAPLAGLTRKPPQLCFQGKTYLLSDRHRVILTGNPGHYDGRHMDSTLKKHLLTLYYRPLSPDTLAELIIQPALPQSWSPELRAHTTRAMLSLYQHYGNLLPDDLSPRDLQDVLAHMNQMLRHARKAGAEIITSAQASTLVWQAFSDSLAGSIPPAHQLRAMALEHWYQGHFPGDAPEDKRINEPRQLAFQCFLAKLRQTYQDIDLNTGPVVELVRHYWLFLDKQQDTPRGRRGLLVEGPAGWGKDLILSRVLNLWHQHQQQSSSTPFIHINASPAQWGAQVSLIKSAMDRGQKLVISELNLLPSRYLEGLFNEVLTGDAQPGFALFATVNPPSFGGRQPLSTAFKNRCTQVQLNPLGKDDLNGILQRRFHGQFAANKWLSQRYQVLSDQLVKSQSPIQLTLDDLFRGAEALQGYEQGDWPQRFQSCYGLALESLRWRPETLEKAVQATQSEPVDDGRIQRQQALSLWLNRQHDVPVTVQLLPADAQPAFHPSSSTLLLPDQSDPGELQKMAGYALEARHQTGSDPVVPGSFGGDITQPKHYITTQFFAGKQFDTGDYRLQVKTLTMMKGELQEINVSCNEGGVEPLSLPGWPDSKTTLSEGQQLGTGKFRLHKEEWLPLPGISARDQLIYLRCRNGFPLEVARGKKTGQLLVKLAETAPGDDLETTLNFIIKPDYAGLKPLVSGEAIQVCDGLCDPAICQQLDDDVFSKKSAIHTGCHELQTIKAISDPCQRLHALATWCKRFGDIRDVPGSGLKLLMNLIRERQGVCRHRSQVFQVLSQYFGVPARMVSNDCHQYVEISPDGGKHWRRVDLGGGGQVTKEQAPQPLWPDDIIPAPSGARRVGEAVSGFWSYRFNDLYKRCLQASDKAEAWQELQTFLTTEYTKHFSFVYCLLNGRLFETLLDEGFKLDQALPDLFQSWQRQMKEVRNHRCFEMDYMDHQSNALIFLLKIHDLWQSEILSEQRYSLAAGRCLELIKQGVPPAGTLLPLLEQLTQDASWGEQAEALLDDFYQQLTQPGQWQFPEELLTFSPSEINDWQGESRTLLATLNQTVVENEWSLVSTGRPPNIERMAQKQAAFPVSQEGHGVRPVFFSLPFLDPGTKEQLDGIFDDFVKDRTVQDKIPGMKELAAQENEYFYNKKKVVLVAFLTWLFRQDTQKTWRCLVCEAVSFGDIKRKIRAPLPGCYPAFPQIKLTPEFLGKFLQVTGLGYVHIGTKKTALNPERVKKAFGEPSALVIRPDLLGPAYREYLETMNWSLLLKDGDND